jgi:lipopolysaccharide export system permease protein
MIKRLHSLVIKSYIGPLILTFFIAEFVLIMHFLWLYIEDLVGKGLEWTIIAELLLYASAGLVKMALPLAILLASIMTFGNFGENFELSAMKSAGISLQRIMMPLIIFSVFLSIASFFWSNNVIPYTNLKTGSLLYDVSNQRPELNIKPGIFNSDIEGYSIKIRKKNPNSPMMYDFMIYDHTERRGNPKVTLADSGMMQVTDNQKYMIITLYGGKTYEEMQEKNPGKKIHPERHETFEKQTIIAELKGFDLERTDETLFKHHYQMKTIAELEYSKDSLNKILEARKEQFVIGLNRTRFFRFDKQFAEPDLNPDIDSLNKTEQHVQNKPKPKSADVPDMIKRLSPDAKERMIREALDNAEATRSYIESNISDMAERQKNINKHQIAWHEKFTLSFACLIFFFIGAPLGAIIRKGGFGLPFLVSIIFFLLYYVVSLAGRKFVEESVLQPWQGMWLSSLLTLPLGILFTYKATTDSVLFDATAYVDLLKRPFKFLQIEYKDPSVVFHKHVELQEDEELQANLNILETKMNEITETIDKQKSTIKKVFLSLFIKDQTHLKEIILMYNTIYDMLAVNYRDRIFLKASLEKFPKLEFEMYEISPKRRKFNFLFMTVFIVPIGIYLFFQAFFKLIILKQKFLLIREQLLHFKGAPEHL